MRQLRAWFLRLGGLFDSAHREKDLAAEMASHLQMHIEDNLREGMSAAEARRQAMIKLGGVEQTKENCRDRRGLPFLEVLLQDLRFGVRMFVKNPGFAVAAVITLALGIGANTALFSVVNGVLLRPLPYRDPSRLVVVSLFNQKTQETFPLCDADFLDWRAQNQVFTAVAAFSGARFNITGSGAPEQVLGDEVTAEFFSTLGVKPSLGRTFLPDEDRPGSPRAVVLSYNHWRRRYGSNPGVIGQTIMLNGSNSTVIGVMPQSSVSALGRNLGGMTPMTVEFEPFSIIV